jgi:formate hydrogenlyase subunit 4
MGDCMMVLIITLLQSLIFVISAPLLIGLVKWSKCQLQNRRGPSVLQPYRDLRKLFRKEAVVASTASRIFRITPYIIFGVTVLASAAIPLFIANGYAGVIADAIVLVGLFGLARFFIALAGMDVGTSFGGMGSSREMMVSALAEPALLMAFFALAMIASSTNLVVMVKYLMQSQLLFHPSLIFVALGFAIVAIAETGRIPVDNPATHLELTMIHEAMILEYSGRHLALIEWAAQIKFMIYCVLFINLFLPLGIAGSFDLISLVFGLVGIALKLIFLVMVLVVAEINLAKFRLFRVPNLLNFAFLFCLLGVLIHIILEVG